MVSQVDQQRVCALLTEAVTVICKNGLTFNNKFCIEGLLGITLDDRNMFLVNIKESITKGTSGGNATNQNKSQSGSKAGVFVGMPNVQSNGGRGAGPMPMQRPTRGMSPAMMQQQQQLQRRRPGGPQPQVIPAKRPVPAMGPNPNIGRGRGGGPMPGPGQSGSMPQEWAALIQLQQQQPPGMLPSTRGRSRGTARRGGMNRMQHRAIAGIPGEVKSPPRRMSQSGVELESREEVERKAAEQARLRSERLERRRSGGPHESILGTPGKSIESDGESPEKPRITPPPPKIESSRQDEDGSAPSSTPDKDPPEMDTKAMSDTADSTDDTKDTKEEPTAKAEHETTEDTADDPTPTKAPTPTPTSKQQEPTTGGSGSKGGAAEGQPEGADGTKQEGDGSWLLSNSSWLLGDLESMASNTSWKDSAQSDKSQDTAKGKQDDSDP